MKKIKSKKLLSLIVAIVMVIGLLPLDAFANAELNKPAEVVENGEAVSSSDGLVTVQKTAKHTSDNNFEITLSVTTKDKVEVVPAEATHAVLVIDQSNSMEGSAIREARNAAKEFAGIMLGEDAAEDNQVAVVSYATYAKTRTGLTGDYSTVESAVNQIRADGGTNIQAGIHAAQQILAQDTSDANKVILVLSDGEPTYSYQAIGESGWTGCSYGPAGLVHWWNHGKYVDPHFTHFNYDRVVGEGNSYWMDDTGRLYGKCEHGETWDESWKFFDNNGEPTILEASYAKDAGTEIYSIFLDNYSYHEQNSKKNAMETMKGVASGDDHFKTTSDVDDLAEIFKGIANEVITPTSAGTVSDPMGQFIVLGDVSSLASQGISLTENGLLWNVSQVEPTTNADGSKTYTVTYPITLDTAAEGFVEEQAYATNGTTTFTYKFGGAECSVNFDVPTVKGYVPVTEYTIRYLYKNKETQQYVEGKTETKTAKLWTEITVDSNNYSKENYHFVSGDNGPQIITPDKLEFVLYYDPILASVVVNHLVSEKITTDDGVQYTEPECQDTDTYNCYQGDTFTNEKFLNADQYTLEKSIQVNGTTYTTDNYQNITLPGGQTVLNLYYTTAGEDQRTPVDYEIHYWYRTDSWKLNAEGKYEKVTGTYTEAEGETVTAEGYHGTTVTAPDKAGECKLDTEKTPSTSLKLDKNGTNRLDIYYYKEAPEAPEFGTATLTIRHVYKQELPTTGEEDKNIVEVPEDNWTECENKTVYVGETWQATPDLKDGYTLKTLASDFTVKIDEADKAYEIVVEYYKDARQPAEVVINHHYTTYTWTVDAATGEGKYVETGSEDLNGVHATGEWYAGQEFTPAQIPNGYTYVRGGDEKVLTSGLNTFDLYYETYVDSEVNEADVTINHIYETYVSYVDDNGNVIRDQLQGEPTAESETHYGKVGDVIEATKQEKDGFTFYQADTDDLKVTLQGVGGQYNLHYKKTIDELGSQYPVTVQPIYKTYRMYVNEDGQIDTELINTENGTPVPLGQFYAKQKVTAVAADYAKAGFAFDAEAAENTKDLSVTVSADGSNTIQIVYKQVNDQRGLPGVVMVNNVYTTVTKYVANGEVKTSEETVVGSNTSYGPYYVGQFFDTTDKSTEWAGYQLDTNKTQPAAQVKIDGATTQITFYWVREVDHTSPATVKVIHHYTINDANPFGNSSSWTVGEDDKPLTGYYQGQYYLAHYDFQDGRFTQEHVTEVVPSEAATEPGTILQGQTNEIHIYYVKNVDTRVPSSVKVVHNYYADEAALKAGTVEATFEEHYDKMEADVYTAALRTEHNGLAYEFHSATPENYTITVVADAEKNVINISYVRAQVTYTVAHEYYTNDAMSGRTVVELTGKVGDVIKAEDIDKVTSFEGNTYTYTSASADSITLTNGENAIVLRYDRTTSSGGGGGSTTSYYKVTVNYYDADGNKIADSFVSSNIRRGGSWDFSDKQLETITVGDVVYTFSHADGDPITGSDIRSNQVVNLYYAADTDIDDGDTPLDPGPGGETGEPGDGTGTGDGGEVDIDDGDTPLDPGPGGETGGETNIDDGEVPQAGLPQTGAAMATVNPGLAAGILALAATMAFGGIAYTVRRKKEEDAQ